MSLRDLYAASFEAQEENLDEIVDVTDAELDSAETSVEEAEVELNNVSDDDKTLELVNVGLESLLSDIDAIQAANALTLGSLKIANTAYRAHMSHLTANPGHLVSSMEEAELAEVDVEKAEDANETESTSQVDVSVVVPVEVSTEAMDNVKAKLAKAGVLVKETAKKTWEKILEVLKRITEFFDFAGKRAKALKAKVSALKDEDRKEGEFKVPGAAALAVGGDASLASVLAGASVLKEQMGAVIGKAGEYVAKKVTKDADPEAPSVVVSDSLAAKESSGGVQLSAKQGNFDLIRKAAGEVKNDAWGTAPSKADLQKLVAASEELSAFAKHAGGIRKGLEAAVAVVDGTAVSRKYYAAVGRFKLNAWLGQAARTSRNLQKVVEAGLKAYGAEVPAATGEPAAAAE